MRVNTGNIRFLKLHVLESRQVVGIKFGIAAHFLWVKSFGAFCCLIDYAAPKEV